MPKKAESAIIKLAVCMDMIHSYNTDLDREISATPLWSGLGLTVICGQESTDEVNYFNLNDEYIIAGELARHASWIIAKIVSMFNDNPESFLKMEILPRIAKAANKYLNDFNPHYQTPFALATNMIQEARLAIIDYIIRSEGKNTKVPESFSNTGEAATNMQSANKSA